MIKSEGNGGFDAIEEGNYPSRVFSIALTGKEEYEGKVSNSPKMVVSFEIPDETIEIDGEDLPRHLSSFMAASVSEKSNFYKIIKASQLDEDDIIEEVDGATCVPDPSPLIGQPVSISIEHNKKGREKIIGYAKLRDKEIKKLDDLSKDGFIFDPYEEDPMVLGEFDQVHDWIVKKAAEALDMDDFSEAALELIEARMEDIEEREEEEDEKPKAKSKSKAKKGKASSKAKKGKSSSKTKSKSKSKKAKDEDEDEDFLDD